MYMLNCIAMHPSLNTRREKKEGDCTEFTLGEGHKEAWCRCTYPPEHPPSIDPLANVISHMFRVVALNKTRVYGEIMWIRQGLFAHLG